jgi:hypothetical protein
LNVLQFELRNWVVHCDVHQVGDLPLIGFRRGGRCLQTLSVN